MYQIITDSCCDFENEKYEALHVKAAPLSVTFRGKTYPDSNDEGMKELYAGLRQGETAVTSAVNPEGWAEKIRPVLEQGMDALVIAFSSGLSATFQSAVIASEELQAKFPERKICVVDSLSASLGQGLLVWYAEKMHRDGKTLEQVQSWLEENRLHCCHWVIVDDLMYLKRGGRIHAAAAVVGTMLGMKPLIHVDNEGKLVNVGKIRGRRAGIDALVKKYGELAQGCQNEAVFISHGDCIEDARLLEQLLKEKYAVKEVYINYIGTVIGSHAGPGTLALFFMGRER